MRNLSSRWVYIFGMENGGDTFGDILGLSAELFKIGTTINPVRRLQQVQIHSPWELRVFMLIPGSYSLEKAFHESLEEYRTRGEWFSMHRCDMDAFLEDMESHNAIAREAFPSLPWINIACEGVAR